MPFILRFLLNETIDGLKTTKGPVKSIIKVTGQTRLPLIAKCIKKPLE